jgi:hypothetical protein
MMLQRRVEYADAAALVKAIGAHDARQRTAQQRRWSCAKETIRSSNRSLFGSRIASLPSLGRARLRKPRKRLLAITPETKKAALNRDWIFFAIDLCRSSG